MAWEIFSLRFLREVVNDNILPLQAFPNGSPRAPVAGALLIWDKGGEFKDTGHVAIITQLHGNKVRIAEQRKSSFFGLFHGFFLNIIRWASSTARRGGSNSKPIFKDREIWSFF